MKRLHLILVLILSATFLFGAKKPEKKTIFETGTEEIKERKKAVLSIPTAKGLEIYISGEIHSSETLRIYEYNQQEQGEEIYQGQGALKAKQPILLIDNEILVTLNTKDKATRKGATVEIKELKTEKYLEYVRKDIADIFHKLEKDEYISNIDINIKESNDVLDKLKTQDHKQLSESLRTLVGKYRSIASQKKPISQAHQSIQKHLSRLSKQTKKWSRHLNSNLKKKSDIEQELIKQQSLRWEEGSKNLNTLSEQISAYNKVLNDLFKVLEENAQIFYETANSIDLNLNPLSKVLEKLVDSKEILQALDKHWQTINKLKENLKQDGFL